MTTVAAPARLVTGGVDTHLEVHVAAALDPLGALLGTAQFPVSAAGYRQLLEWLRSFGDIGRVGVEGAGSYGGALARHLTKNGVQVVEVSRPNRQVRRRHGKTDTVDAIAAARAVMSVRRVRRRRRTTVRWRACTCSRCCSAARTTPAPRRSTSSRVCS